MKSLRKLAVVLAALLALGGAPAALGAVDYSKNSVSGEYAQPVSAQPAPVDTPSDSAFEWGDAAVGAGVALALVLLVPALRSGVGAIQTRSREELGASGR
jgi:hypothetical protein